MLNPIFAMAILDLISCASEVIMLPTELKFVHYPDTFDLSEYIGLMEMVALRFSLTYFFPHSFTFHKSVE